jgi:hypothetical protein
MANIPKSQILVTLMMEGVNSSGMSVLTRATRHIISEDAVLHSHRRENLISYLLWLIVSECQLNYTANKSSVQSKILIYLVMLYQFSRPESLLFFQVNEELLERKVAAPV